MGPTTILILGGVIALILLVIGLIVTATEERSLVDDRLEYLEEEGVEVIPRKAVIGEWVGKQATRYTWGQSLTRSLARADIKMKVGEFILLVAGTNRVRCINRMVSRRRLEFWQVVNLTSQFANEYPGILIGGAIGFLAPIIYLTTAARKTTDEI